MFWRNLDIPTRGAIKEHFKFPTLQQGHGVHWKYSPEQVFSMEWYTNFRDKVKFDGDPTVILFGCEKNQTNDYAHIDINETHKPVTMVPSAFNWVVGGSGSHMVWYDQYGVTEEALWHGPVSNTWTATDPRRHAPQAAIWKASTLTELTRLQVPTDHITLVNTGIAHRIELGAEDRWCFSIRPPFKDSDNWESYINMATGVIAD